MSRPDKKASRTGFSKVRYIYRLRKFCLLCAVRNLTLRQLHAMTTVDRLGKITLAAREIGLTAPAVTLQIQQAEAEAGTVLFDRTADGLRATDAGRAVIAAAQTIEERLSQLRDELTAIRGAGRGTLRLGAVSTAKYFAPKMVAAFMAALPGIEVRLIIGNRAATIAAIENHEVDFALMGRPPRQVPLRSYLIGDHPLVIIAAPDHPLARVRRITRSRIADETFLVREPGSGTRMSLELFLGEIPGRLDNLGVEFGSNESIKQAVMAGLGVGFISAHTIAMEVELGRLAILDVVDTPIQRHWFAVSRSDRSLSPAMAAFKDFIIGQGRTFLPDIAGLNA
ncbi:LysR family transcriptional regulator [Sphingomonas sp. AR_OL41]|uniref:LysR family transcriptional regulator n=1 Tax=Sphingomonas sp. AR_OL41 TaxID=3042729 RepID=UPI0024805876|nr:LysR family transcriptional regulator [Sphingomonas sp. AR_OL41]MDH7972452.1 LysR family transcriptional regulator [Sphingomonas sp. AR_OL41]